MDRYADGVQGISATALYPLETAVKLIGEVNGKISTNDVFLLLDPLIRRADRIFNVLEDAIDDKFTVTYDMQGDEVVSVYIVKDEA